MLLHAWQTNKLQGGKVIQLQLQPDGKILTYAVSLLLSSERERERVVVVGIQRDGSMLSDDGYLNAHCHPLMDRFASLQLQHSPLPTLWVPSYPSLLP